MLSYRIICLSFLTVACAATNRMVGASIWMDGDAGAGRRLGVAQP
jgi:hypothetical protein